MARLIRYRRDKPNDFRPHTDGSLSMSSFVISGQIRHPCLQAAAEVIGIAKSIAPKKSGTYARSFGIGPAKKFWFKPVGEPLQLRAVVEVVNTDDKAVAMEFGSGEGSTDGEYRPQGGGNLPYRVLGRAGGKVGDFHE
jgi:hypothetical protein